MEIWAHVFDKIKLENERMTLWNAICPYDTHLLPNFDNVWDCLPIHCVIPCVINLQAPTPKFGKEYGARDSPHHPPKLKPVIEPQFLTFKPNHPNKNYNCLTNRCPHFINVTPIKIHPVLTPGVFGRIINLLSYEVLLGYVRMATIGND